MFMGVQSVKRCADCECWYRLGGSVKGQCFKQHKKETLYNNDCSDFGLVKVEA